MHTYSYLFGKPHNMLRTRLPNKKDAASISMTTGADVLFIVTVSNAAHALPSN